MEELLKVEKVNKTFLSHGYEKKALTDVNFTLNRGEILGIIGESGSGKSTLLRIISKQIRANNGEIIFKGKKLEDYEKELYQLMQMVFQDSRSSFNPKHTIGRALDEIKSHLNKEGKDNCYLLERVGLVASYENKFPSQLSGGECQRAAIARAFSVMPDLILCDEVTSALDVCAQARVIDLIIHLSKVHNIAIIFVSHDLPLVSTFCDRLLIMKNGIIVEDGQTKEILQNPKSPYTRDLMDHLLEI